MNKNKKLLVKNQKIEIHEEELTKEQLTKLHKIETKQEIIRVVKFFLFSASAAVIQAVSMVVLQEVFTVRYWLSYAIALVLSVIWNFSFNRKFTFKSSNNVPKAMMKVGFYYLIFAPLSIWWVKVFTGEDFLWNPYVVEGVTMLINGLTEVLFYRFVVFGNSINTSKLGQKENKEILHDLGLD